MKVHSNTYSKKILWEDVPSKALPNGFVGILPH